MSSDFRRRADELWRCLLPCLSILLLSFLAVMPWPLPYVGTLTAPLALIAVVYWVLTRPGLVPPVALFFIGLFQDVLTGYPFGLSAFLFIAVHLLFGNRLRYFVGGSFILSWLVFIIAALTAALLQALVYLLLNGTLPPSQPLLLQMLLIVALYPFVVRLLLSPVNAGLPEPQPV